jgi:NADH:ubiquinone oxidoreductase subunit F (NADH-binding)
MSCCGQKRKQWIAEQRQSDQYEHSEAILDFEEKEKPQVLFEYVGESQLVLEGLSTGEKYQFQSKGQQIKVHFEDSFSLMAEPNLKVIKNQALI